MWGEEGVASDYKLTSFLNAINKTVQANSNNSDNNGLIFTKVVNHGKSAKKWNPRRRTPFRRLERGPSIRVQNKP